MDLASERLYALVSAQASSVDGKLYNLVQTVGTSAFLFTGAEMFQRMMNKITSPSATLISGGSAGAVAVTMTGLPSGINGLFHNWPFSFSAAGALSAQPTSLISTASTNIRKVLVTLGMSAFTPQSSFALAGGTVQFVYGSVFTTSAGAVTSGGQSAYFNSVPLPKPSAGEIPLGWINVFNSFAVSAEIGRASCRERV